MNEFFGEWVAPTLVGAVIVIPIMVVLVISIVFFTKYVVAALFIAGLISTIIVFSLPLGMKIMDEIKQRRSHE